VLYATIFRWRVTANVFNETFNLRASLALVSPPRIDRPAELSRKDLNFDETTLKPRPERAIDSFISRDEGFKTTKAYSFFPPGIDIRRTSTSMYDPIGAASIIYQRQVARARARVGPSRSQLTMIKLAV